MNSTLPASLIDRRNRIAVIGGGVAGITASYLLQRRHDVVLFDAHEYLGGHTHTFVIPSGPDEGTPVDTGFIVLNDKTYPLLHRLLNELGVAVRDADMSFGFYSKPRGFCYAGTGLNGLFADRMNLFKPSYYSFLKGIIQFGRLARVDLETGIDPGMTMAAYMQHRRVPRRIIDDFVIPMAAAIWSAPREDVQTFPALTLLRFWHNHGLLSMDDRPQWQTVVGGSHAYVKAFRHTFRGEIRLNNPIRSITRSDSGVTVSDASGNREAFDLVVIATHGDEALKLLADPDEAETRLLGAWTYRENETILHSDVSFLPPMRRAWASWNYVELEGDQDDRPVPVTYHMNRLQGLDVSEEYCVTLNPNRPVADDRILYRVMYTHPVYNEPAIRSQQELRDINGRRRTLYCGSYFGYGFHEDAVRSASDAVTRIGIDW